MLPFLYFSIVCLYTIQNFIHIFSILLALERSRIFLDICPLTVWFMTLSCFLRQQISASLQKKKKKRKVPFVPPYLHRQHLPEWVDEAMSEKEKKTLKRKKKQRLNNIHTGYGWKLPESLSTRRQGLTTGRTCSCAFLVKKWQVISDVSVVMRFTRQAQKYQEFLVFYTIINIYIYKYNIIIYIYIYIIWYYCVVHSVSLWINVSLSFTYTLLILICLINNNVSVLHLS